MAIPNDHDLDLTSSTNSEIDHIGEYNSFLVYSSDEEASVDLSADIEDIEENNFNSKKIPSGLGCLTWNMCSCISERSRLPLINRMNQYSYGVVQLQETRIAKEDARGFNLANACFTGYRKYMTFAEAATKNSPPRVGLVTLVRDDIPHKRFYHPKYKNNHFENICIKIRTSLGIIECQNVYYHDKLDAKKQPKPQKGDPESVHLYHSGDTNARHPNFNDDKHNNLGVSLTNHLTDPELVRLDPLGPTTATKANNDLGSEIDMTIMNPELAAHSTLTIIRNEMSDVHFPQHIEINTKTGLDKSDFVSRFKLETIDLDKFHKSLDDQCIDLDDLMKHPENYDLDEKATIIEEMYLKAGKDSMAMTKWSISPWKSWYWNEEVSKATNTYNHWKKRNRKKNSKRLGLTQAQKINILKNYNLATKKLIETSDKAKQNAIRDICIKITNTKEAKKQWELINSINRGGKPKTRLSHWDSLQEAQTFNNDFIQRTKSDNLTDKVRAIMQGLQASRDRAIENAILTPDPEYDLSFTEYEQKIALSKLRNSAAGEDKIENCMLKHATGTANILTRELINTSWSLGRLPAKWKIAKQVAIPKPDTNPKEFRPISLLPTISKVMESMVTNRLTKQISSKLHPNLIGFLKDRGTEDGIAALVNHLSKQLYKENSTVIENRDIYKHPTMIAFIDFSKAFELADQRVILSTLAKLGVKGKMLGWIKDYLTNRKGFVTINGKQSDTLNFEKGVPQGSKISPCLFNILINELIKTTWPKNVQAYSYADDIVLIYTGVKPVATMQKALDTLSKKCEELGLKVNAKKSKVMTLDPTNGMKFNNYHNKTRITKPQFTIGLGVDSKNIETVKSYKYLGVLFTSTLNWTPRIEVIRKSAYKKTNLLKIMANKSYGVHTPILINYVNTIANAVEYGALALNVGNISVTCKSKLASIIPSALKIALGLPRSTNNEATLIEAGMMPTKCRIEQYSVNKIAKIIHNRNEPNKHPLFDTLANTIEKVENYIEINGQEKIDRKIEEKPLIPPIRNHRNWFEHTYSQLIALNKSASLLNYEYHPHPQATYIPPIGKPHLHDATISIIPLTKKKDTLTMEERNEARVTYESIIETHQRPGTLTCYTDASVDPDSNRAGYAVIPYAHHTPIRDENKTIRISDNSGSTNSELAAINKAIDIMVSLVRHHNSLLIVTDSKSGLEALTSIKNSNAKHWHKVIHSKLDQLWIDHPQVTCTMLWVPSHIGIKGNEEADTAASRALNHHEIEEKVPIPFSLIKKTIKGEIITKWKQTVRINDRYRACNPDLKKAFFPEAPRLANTLIARLRMNAFDLCPWRSVHACCHCDDNFTTAHYLVDCPVTGPKMHKLKDKLQEEDHDKSSPIMAARMLEEQNNRGYPDLIEILEKFPPAYQCNIHDQCKENANKRIEMFFRTIAE